MRTRDDKEPDKCTNAEQVAEMYRNQAVVANNADGASASWRYDD